MKNARFLFLTFVLALPIVGVLALVADKQIEIGTSEVKRFTITGYDPRSLLYGHYLQFSFTGADAPDIKQHEYYIPEDQALALEKLLRGNSHKIDIDVHLKGSKIVNYGMLYIDGKPWRDFLASAH